MLTNTGRSPGARPRGHNHVELREAHKAGCESLERHLCTLRPDRYCHESGYQNVADSDWIVGKRELRHPGQTPPPNFLLARHPGPSRQAVLFRFTEHACGMNRSILSRIRNFSADGRACMRHASICRGSRYPLRCCSAALRAVRPGMWATVPPRAEDFRPTVPPALEFALVDNASIEFVIDRR